MLAPPHLEWGVAEVVGDILMCPTSEYCKKFEQLYFQTTHGKDTGT